MTLEQEDEIVSAWFNTSGELKATICSFPKYHSVCWLKDDDILDMTDPKYKGSKNDESSASLCINNAKKEDAGTYTIEVQNEWGIGQSSLEFEVIEGKVYFDL